MSEPRIIGADWAAASAQRLGPGPSDPLRCIICGAGRGACTTHRSDWMDHSMGDKTLMCVTEKVVETVMPHGVKDPRRASKVQRFVKGQVVYQYHLDLYKQRTGSKVPAVPARELSPSAVPGNILTVPDEVVTPSKPKRTRKTPATDDSATTTS